MIEQDFLPVLNLIEKAILGISQIIYRQTNRTRKARAVNAIGKILHQHIDLHSLGVLRSFNPRDYSACPGGWQTNINQ